MAMNVSVVITFHKEGLIAHKTMRNVADLTSKLTEQGITYEVILHLDRGDSATKDVLSKIACNQRYRLYENTFGDPSLARNFALSQANGQYIALIDGDDIFSTNWLIDGYRILESRQQEKLILHAETDITFGPDETSPRLWRMQNSKSIEQDLLTLFTRNCWISGTFGRSKVIKAIPYRRATDGFGYEDWTYNIETRGSGIRHEVVPGSLHFYRVKSSGSIYQSHEQENVITDYSEAFSTPRIKQLIAKIPTNQPARPPEDELSPLRRIIRQSYKLAHRVPGLKKIASRREQQIQFAKSSFNEHIVDEWTYLNRYDGDIYPSRERIKNLTIYNCDYDYLGRAYCQIISQIRRNPDYLFLPPQLNIGGTEQVVVNYLNAFAKLHPDWHIVVLSSIPPKNPYHIPSNVDFVSFYEIVQKLSEFDRDFLLSRFVIQTQVKRIHIIHNEFCYRWAKKHAKVLSQPDYQIYASQFMYEFNPDPRLKVGFANPYISDIYPLLKTIFTDNQPIINEMAETEGFSLKKMKPHYQPLELDCEPYRPRTSKTAPVRVLWASRLAPQKRPDLIKKIARHLDPAKYHIDVYGRLQPPFTENYFRGIPNVTYKGAYNGIQNLDCSQYDVYLYTSQTDGLPNVLLEMAARGLPTVASDVGGISDFIHHGETGYLVPLEEADQYAAYIEKASQEDNSKMVGAAQRLLQERHSWKHYLNSVKQDIQ